MNDRSQKVRGRCLGRCRWARGSSIKSMIGHPRGQWRCRNRRDGDGLRDGLFPPTINQTSSDPPATRLHSNAARGSTSRSGVVQLSRPRVENSAIVLARG
jgi:hypothetical protein